MKLTDICIRRPVLACVLNLVLVVVGFVSYQKLTVQYFPDIPYPKISISAKYPGASAALMESSITTPIESSLSSVEGIDGIESSSRSGSSSISVNFKVDGNFDEEVNTVRDKIAGVRTQLPDDIDDPVVSVGGVDRPVLNLAFLDNSMTQEQIRDYLTSNVTPILNQVPGVGAVWLYGASSYAMRIWLDPEKMAALNVTVPDITSTLNANNIDFPAGTVLDPMRNYSIISDTRLSKASEFSNLIIRDDTGNVVKMGDVSQVNLGTSSLQESPMLLNGKKAIDVEIRPRYGENPIEVSKSVRDSLAAIKKQLPKSMDLVVTYDQSNFLSSALSETVWAIFTAIALVIIIVFLFLGSFRAALIPIITIPLCLIDMFGIMSLFGFTINIMTLLAMVLSIGLVVDDAIVMLENIYRHIESGLTPFKAALVGSKEIAFPVIAMTITLAAVYAPIGFAQGVTAIVFKEFAFTLAGAVIISGFVALTLSPMMCSYILHSNKEDTKIERILNHVFHHLEKNYGRVLDFIFSKKPFVIASLFLIAALGYVLYINTPAEFIPNEDIGYFETSVTPPSNSSINYIKAEMLKLDKLYAQEPAIAYYASFILGSPTSFVSLKDWDKRDKSLQQVVNDINVKMAKIPGVTAFTRVPSAVNFGSTDMNDLTLQIMTTGSYLSLEKTLDKVKALVQSYPGFTDVTNHLKFDSQQYKLTLNRDLMASLNINPQDVATTLSTMMGGTKVTKVQQDANTYDVKVQMRLSDLQNFAGIQKLYVKDSDGNSVPLSNLIKLTPSIGQATLGHYNRMRASSITAQLKPGYTLSQALPYLDSKLPALLGQNEHFAYSGQTKEFIDSNSSTASLALLSLVFIYLVLAAQFESFIDPLVILLTVPLSVVGALFSLKLAGGSLNLYTNIGLITLIGLITKHGILITQFANALREEGHHLIEATKQAAITRLRPILMTTSAMVLGSVPLALAMGPGSISHRQIGWVIVGGLIFGTFFSLVVVPVAYLYLAKLKRPPRYSTHSE